MHECPIDTLSSRGMAKSRDYRWLGGDVQPKVRYGGMSQLAGVLTRSEWTSVTTVGGRYDIGDRTAFAGAGPSSFVGTVAQMAQQVHSRSYYATS